MAKTNFTPGPWEVRLSKYNPATCLVFSYRGHPDLERRIANCETAIHDSKDRDISLANARLIAAAPEMHNAIIELQDKICNLFNRLRDTCHFNGKELWEEEKETIEKFDELLKRINQ